MSRGSVALVSSIAGLTSALGGSGVALGNGRPPASVNVGFRPGEAETILLPVTFGLLVSRDGGESFRWLCETAVGYGGTFDPDYSTAEDGTIYATTFEGLRRSTDGACTWSATGEPVLNDSQYISEVEVAPDGRVWAATSTGGEPNDVYVSTDGVTFASAGLPDPTAWWLRIRSSAADAERVYVSGFRPATRADPPEALLRRSDDGGATWDILPVDDFDFGNQPQIYLLAASPSNADVLFARVVAAVPPLGDALYRSGDGGQNWTRVLEFADSISAFHIRPDGMTVIAGTVNACPEDMGGDAGPPDKGCVKLSTDGGVTWNPTEEQPRMACLGERADGTLYACGDNWEPDNFALGRSTDGQTWEKVFRFVEMDGPLQCEADSEQAECAAVSWPPLCLMFGICEEDSDGGPSARDAGGDGGGDESDGGTPGEGGCCRVGGGASASWTPGLLAVLLVFGWRARRRQSRR